MTLHIHGEAKDSGNASGVSNDSSYISSIQKSSSGPIFSAAELSNPQTKIGQSTSDPELPGPL
jgi:hypothetical protein